MDIVFFLGLVFGGAISWFLTHGYYRKSSKEQAAISKKLSEEVRKIILEDPRDSLTVLDLNRLLDSKTIDKHRMNQGDPLPYKACPKCGSTDLARGEINRADDNYFVISCKDCDWQDWTQ
jgi:predicted RNA-binding Zn-ribbon protein involved in translation (DUF1610 family)